MFIQFVPLHRPQAPSIRECGFDAALFCNAKSKRLALDTVYSYFAVQTSAASSVYDLVGLRIHYERVMMTPLRSIIALAIISSSSVGTAFAAKQQLRAIYLNSNHFQDDSTLDNSDTGLHFFKQLGYNTVFEGIPPCFGEWDKTNPRQWKMKEPSRTELIAYIRNEKKRVESFGLAFCPFYAEWGWNKGACSISERARASEYRDVAYDISLIGHNVYRRLPKQPAGWSSQPCGSYTWNQDFTAAAISVYRPYALQATSITTGISDTAVRNGQCYEFSTTVELANVQPGDIIKAVIYREFSDGSKPDPAIVPIGRAINPHNNWVEAASTSYEIIRQTAPGCYDIQKETMGETTSYLSQLVLVDSVWIDNEFPFGAGGYTFNKRLRWEFILQTGQGFRKPPSEIRCSKFSVTMLDPLKELAYPEWEKSPQFVTYCSLFPFEKYMSTTLIYICDKDMQKTVTDSPLIMQAYLNQKKPKGKLQRMRGHFIPLHEGIGAPCTRWPLDPLSPASDLIAQEMLTIIKQGLDNKEPDYFLLGGDEVFVYRKDAVSMKGLNNTFYNSLSNGQYYSAIMKKNIERYRAIFHGSDTSVSRTTIVFWADMILPFGEGYFYYAEKNEDASALCYLRETIGPQNIIPIIWVYDYMPSHEKPGTFMVKNTAEIQTSISFCTMNSFHFAVCYATDGTLQDLRAIDNLLDSDAWHIRHEIECARSWCDIVQSPTNAGSCDGLIFTGWNRNLQSNGWNGLVPLAFFGWMRTGERDLPEQWKTVRKQYDQKGQPVLEIINKRTLPAVPSLSR